MYRTLICCALEVNFRDRPRVLPVRQRRERLGGGGPKAQATSGVFNARRQCPRREGSKAEARVQ